MGNTLKYKGFTLDTVTWTPITAPIACSFVVLHNEGAANIYLRSDDGDATTQKTLNPGVQEILSSGGDNRYRFNANDVVLYAQTVSGTGPLRVSFLL